MNRKTLSSTLLLAGLAVLPLQADRFDDPVKKPTSVAQPPRIKSGVQIAELGRMRVFLTFNREAVMQEDQIHQILSDNDFRLFPARNYTELARFDPEIVEKEGEKRKADLVFYTKLGVEEKSSFGEFKIYEASVTSQLYNVLTGELLATHSTSEKGERSTDVGKAKKSAMTKAIDVAVNQTVRKSVEKMKRVIVHETQFAGITTSTQAAKILKAAGKLEGITYVREMWHDLSTGILGLELIGHPKTVNEWKAWVKNLDLTEKAPAKEAKKPTPPKEIKVIRNPKLRKKYPDWFKK